MTKGIVLAGGSGTRLYPLTKSISKQLLPVYDKPTIYYPISILMLAGIREIMIISTPRDLPMIENLLGDGHSLGIHFEYKVQPAPDGIPQAFLLAEKFIGNDPVCLILGDNIFFGQDLPKRLKTLSENVQGAHMFAYSVHDPERYGVLEFDASGKVLSLEEKPARPKSNWASTGLYFYESDVVQYTKNLKPSPRGELEITDLNLMYLRESRLTAHPIGRGTAWLDSGTYDSLLSASQFVQTIEQRQGLKVACLEEIAFLRGYIQSPQLIELSKQYGNCEYGRYLAKIANEKN